jgi:hypothetical protein
MNNALHNLWGVFVFSKQTMYDLTARRKSNDSILDTRPNDLGKSRTDRTFGRATVHVRRQISLGFFPKNRRRREMLIFKTGSEVE